MSEKRDGSSGMSCITEANVSFLALRTASLLVSEVVVVVGGFIIRRKTNTLTIKPTVDDIIPMNNDFI